MRRSPPGSDDAGGRRGAKQRPIVHDHALWESVSTTVEPLRKAKPRVGAGEQRVTAQAPRSTHVSEGGAPSDRRAGKAPASTAYAHAPAVPPHGPMPRRQAPGIHRAPPPLAEFERRKARRIASGTVEIEARLDLHGLRQSEAHHRLVGFVRRCAADGLSTVLVITGKGGRRDTHPDAPFDDLDARDHGVLRRSVPHWLSEPDLRALVVSYTTAGPRHGGSGALYVHLRRRIRIAP